ncbi:hypothetical protein LCM19_08505 [Qipengyuania flava]|nr:hypothetical protein [Qipengyuania flava]
MKTAIHTNAKSRQTVRLAVMTAALGVAGMFTAAATFAADNAPADQTELAQQR